MSTERKLDTLKFFGCDVKGGYFATVNTPFGDEELVQGIKRVVGLGNNRALLIKEVVDGTKVLRIPYLVEFPQVELK